MTPGPSLRLRFTMTGGDGLFHLVAEPRDAEPVDCFGSIARLQEVLRDLHRPLWEFKHLVSSATEESGVVRFGDELDEAFATLHDASLNLLDALAPASERDKRRLTHLVRRLLTERPPSAPPPILEVDAPRDLWAPIELLAYEHAIDPIPDVVALRAACRRFVGLSAIVHRRISPGPGEPVRQVSGPTALTTGTTLPVFLLQDGDLPQVEAERQALEILAPKLRLHGPWPSEAMPSRRLVEELVHHMRDPWRAPADDGLDLPIAVMHFACHCETQSGDHSLHLGIAGAAAGISLWTLNARRVERGLDADAGTTEPERPLVFLNACSSATLDDRSSSFADLFLRSEHRGFIGTSTDVPDLFAARFAAEFYERLVAGVPLGRALHDARWRMLDHRQSPLGILYSMYADPGLHVPQHEGAVG